MSASDLSHVVADRMLCHGAELDRGIKYPPYGEHVRTHDVVEKLMS
jgi:hypothetical protein